MPDWENLDDWLDIIKEFAEGMPMCPLCGGFLRKAKFVDSNDADDKPSDVNEDYYCGSCEHRWAETPAPHEFFKES